MHMGTSSSRSHHLMCDLMFGSQLYSPQLLPALIQPPVLLPSTQWACPTTAESMALRHTQLHRSVQAQRIKLAYVKPCIRVLAKASAGTSGTALQLRRGKQSDGPEISKIIISERMNPLGLKPERFTVAERQNEGIIGFGQLELKKDGAGGQREWELRSLVVKKHARSQGVGSQIVTALVAQAAPGDRIVLTTLSGTHAFYERLGFCTITDRARLPTYLALEQAVGNWVARLAVGQDCIVMERTVS